MEEQEIKRLQPEVNRQLRNKLFPFALYYYQAEDGYIHLIAEKIKKSIPPGFKIVKEYPKLAYAKGHLDGLIEEFELCQHKCGDKTGMGHCFNYEIGRCHGACASEERPDLYNARVMEAVEYLQRVVNDNFFIIDAGRQQEEKSVVMVEQGQVTGFGYFESGTAYLTPADLRDVVKPIKSSRDAQRIVHWYVKEKKMEKVLPF